MTPKIKTKTLTMIHKMKMKFQNLPMTKTRNSINSSKKNVELSKESTRSLNVTLNVKRFSRNISEMLTNNF